MKCYFHCDANMYRRRVRLFLEYTAVPAVMTAVFLTVCLLLSLRNLMHNGFLFPAVILIGSVIFAFALITRIMLEIAEHRVRVHSKYTYIEIGLKDVIVSLYAGGFTHFGERTVIRRLVVIPLDGFGSAEVVKNGRILIRMMPGSQQPKPDRPSLIRDYRGNTDRLGYYFKNGNLEFKEFFFEERGFTPLEEVFIPRRFENAEKIVESILAAKERFCNLTPDKPYVFEEMPFVKTRKIRSLAKRIRGR